MSRDIRFRGKRIDNGEWIYGSLLDGDIIVAGPVDADGDYIGVGEWCSVDRKTVGQFTGLRDKNGRGREMYEGDVYKQDSRHYIIECSEYYCGWVVRSLASGAVLPGHLKGEVAVYDDYEFIGSIHEHPHLLEARSAIGTTE